ncbi:MAG: glycosyltransferase family 4 protein [bacterium]
MNIAIDGRWFTKSSGGIVTYLTNIVKYLSIIDKKNTYFILVSDKISYDYFYKILSGNKNFKIIKIKSSPYSPSEHIIIPEILREIKAEILHSPHFMIPLIKTETKTIITIHDLMPFIFRDYLPPSRIREFFPIYRSVVNRTARIANHIITVSKHSSNDIKRILGINSKKITIIYSAADENFKPLGDRDPSSILDRYNIRRPYLLFVGRQEFNKNIPGIIEAFVEVRLKGYNVQLVMITEPGRFYKQVEPILEDENLKDSVIITGMIPQEDLYIIYSSAYILLIPSFYEGFGLPAVEAMASRVPVIVSDRSSLPEVTGDAGLYVDPEREDLIAEAIIKLLSDEKIREDYANKCYERSKEFSWEKTVKNTIKVYEKIARQK